MDSFHECDAEVIAQVVSRNGTVAPGLCPGSAKTEKISEYIAKAGENIVKIAGTAVPAVLQPIMTVGVVYLPLLRITEHLIRFGAFFEVRFRLFISGIAIRMIFHRQLAIGFFNLTCLCRSAH